MAEPGTWKLTIKKNSGPSRSAYLWINQIQCLSTFTSSVFIKFIEKIVDNGLF